MVRYYPRFSAILCGFDRSRKKLEASLEEAGDRCIPASSQALRLGIRRRNLDPRLSSPLIDVTLSRKLVTRKIIHKEIDGTRIRIHTYTRRKRYTQSTLKLRETSGNTHDTHDAVTREIKRIYMYTRARNVQKTLTFIHINTETSTHTDVRAHIRFVTKYTVLAQCFIQLGRKRRENIFYIPHGFYSYILSFRIEREEFKKDASKALHRLYIINTRPLDIRVAIYCLHRDDYISIIGHSYRRQALSFIYIYIYI